MGIYKKTEIGLNQEIHNGNNNKQAGRDLIEINNENYFVEAYKPRPIIFYEDDIVNVIEIFNKEYGSKIYKDENYNSNVELDEFEMIEKEEKNKKNKLSEAYFSMICDRYLIYFKKINNFLRSPINGRYRDKYRSTAMVLNMQITQKRSEYDYFDEILTGIVTDIISKECKLKEDSAVFIMFLNFMYWNCDIGER